MLTANQKVNTKVSSSNKIQHILHKVREDNTSRRLTIRCKRVSLIDGDAQDVLIHVSDVKLTVKIPLGVHRVVERPGGEDLISHGHFAVRVTFT